MQWYWSNKTMSDIPPNDDKDRRWDSEGALDGDSAVRYVVPSYYDYSWQDWWYDDPLYEVKVRCFNNEGSGTLDIYYKVGFLHN